MTEIDFLDPSTFEHGVPHAAYRRLRDEAPVTWHPRAEEGYWLITRHRDVHQASTDTAHFSSWRGTTIMHSAPPEQVDIMRMMVLNMDPPDHTRYRRLISRAFAVRAVEKMEPRVTEIVRALLDRVAPRGACDFVADISNELPLQVILELIGVPEADRPRLLALSDQMTSPDDEDHGAGREAAVAGAMEMYSYAFALATERRAHPRDDLLTYLLQAEVDGERLNDTEINAFFLLLVVAGNETVRNLLSGGLQALFDNPAERALLMAEPSLLPAAVEEMLRYVSPVMQFRRTASCDFEFHGHTIRDGQKVILAHASANFDERVFTAPERFDIRRAPNPHIAFGVGPHLCLGAALARLEARILFAELLRRFPDIAPAGPARRLRSNFINGIKSLPVELTPRP